MEFKREWDATCPKVWDRWEKDGVQWWIQDLPPEDDELALEILKEHFVPDEVLCTTAGILEDPVSLKFMLEAWLQCLKKRMTLACYTYVNGEKTLAGFNMLFVKCLGEEDDHVMVEEKPVRHVIDTIQFSESGVDVFKYYGIDKILYCTGLVVRREFRRNNIGEKLLRAREPLCKHLGIEATCALCTGLAPQKLTMKCGFEHLSDVTFKQLAELGLNYPIDENNCFKFVSKRYN